MHTIELECPACDELLELDAGFAGGVCRCSSCGTLMTVPSDAQAGGHAEQLTRPDRPDDPSGMSGMGEAAGAEEPSAGDRPTRRGGGRQRPGRPTKRGQRGKAGRHGKGKRGGQGKRPRAGGDRSAETIEQGVYTTASGRQVRIDRPTRVPMAQSKRKGIRIATTLVFFSIVLVVVAVGGAAIWYMLANPKGGPRTDPHEPYVETDPTQFVYNAAANPFELEQPNVVGLPVKGTVAVVFENTPSNADWLEPVTAMVAAGLSRPGGEAKVLVYAAGPDGVASLGRTPQPLNRVTATDLARVLSDRNTRTGDVARALRYAIQDNADAVVLITGQPSADAVADWRDEFASHPGVVLHAVMLNGFSTDYRSWVRERDGGRFISLSVSEVLDWQDEAVGE
jgi:hypothetical protein